MIGNDIVDLQLAKKESNWQRRGFLDKLFTSEEQELITSSSDPFQMVWLLWTMKESAYKAFLQQDYNRIFSPKSIRINLISKSKATVLIHNTTFYAHSEINEELIHTIASSQKGARILSSDFFILNNTVCEARHLETYHKTLQAFSGRLKLSPVLFEIRKDGMGIPYLYKDKKRLKHSLSITHHGSFGAFCIGH